MPIYTLSSIRSMVWDRLDQNTVLYTSDDVDREINDCIRAWNAVTGAIVAKKDVSGGTVSGQVIYRVPSGILFPLHIAISGKEILKTSISKISEICPSWPADRTSGLSSNWIPIGIDKFALWKAMLKDGVQISVFGVAEPIPLVSPSDSIEFNDEDAQAIAELAAVNLVFREGGLTFATASMMYQNYLSRLKTRSKYKNIKLPRYWMLRKEPENEGL